MSRGHDRERAVQKLLEGDGWWTTRAAGSLGDADVTALKAGEAPRLIEVKSTTASAFSDFGPQDRAELLAAAEVAGAEPWLVWWPKRKPPKWIPSSEWPADRRAAA